MPSLQWELQIKDILEAVNRIGLATANMNFAGFLADTATIDAVVKDFSVIASAAKHMPESVRKNMPEIPWKEMAGIRDALNQDYFGVDVKTVWRAAKEKIPTLKPLIANRINR